jgi:hypothetical protein
MQMTFGRGAGFSRFLPLAAGEGESRQQPMDPAPNVSSSKDVWANQREKENHADGYREEQ